MTANHRRVPQPRIAALPVWRVAADTRRWRLARRIANRSQQLASESDQVLAEIATALRWKARRGALPRRLLVESFAVVRESARRAHGQSHFLEQLVAGIALTQRQIVEMQTGEGKTLAALLPALLQALYGCGVHVVTANDYLARRDAEFAAAVFQRLGISVGCVHHGLDRSLRSAEYRADVTYGTAREFGFDFLRDRLTADAADENSPAVQRGHYFALVDEADNVMIDDARTPLLIATSVEPDETSLALYQWCTRQARNLVEGTHFQIVQRQRIVKLTHLGCRHALRPAKTTEIKSLDIERIYRQLEKALAAEHLLRRDRDYVVRDGAVEIVDESTGRVSEGRKWQDGLHQAVESKEGVEITASNQTAARITVQNYFRRYRLLAGLTGTAHAAQREFQKVYKLGVTVIPPRLPGRRARCRPRVFPSLVSKYEAIADEIQWRLCGGQAILVGTPSVRASQQLSGVLSARQIDHAVLNCTRHDEEAEIIRRAGQPGAVTIATNMAGRGTDILVDPQVLAAGGLHVIATEMHSSCRIDRQLIGRTARQGQPGSYQFILSLQDELLASGDAVSNGATDGRRANRELSTAHLRLFHAAQRRVEKQHARQRIDLLKHEQQLLKTCRSIGLDPLLEAIDE